MDALTGRATKRLCVVPIEGESSGPHSHFRPAMSGARQSHLAQQPPSRSGGFVPASERFGGGVTPVCDGREMTEWRRLRGIELRYVLTMDLFLHGPATITLMVQRIESHGFDVASPAPKTVSDALRWERRLGRVRRLGRGTYDAGEMPRGTEHRIHQRVLALRAEAESLRGGHKPFFPSSVTEVTSVTKVL